MKGAIAVVWAYKGEHEVRWRDKVKGVLMVAEYPYWRRSLAQDRFEC